MNNPELIFDCLKELMNISLSKGADAFSDITGRKVIVHMHEPEFFHSSGDYENLMNSESNLIVKVDFSGEIEGSTLFFYTGKHISAFEQILERQDMEYENFKVLNSFILETSNILAGRMSSQLSNLLQVDLTLSEPDNYTAPSIDLQSKYFMLFVKAEFEEENQEFKWPILIYFHQRTIENLIEKLDKLICFNMN